MEHATPGAAPRRSRIQSPDHCKQALNIQLRARLPDLHRFPGTDSVRPLFRQAHDPTIRVLGKHVAAAERIPARPHHLQTLAVQRVCRHRHSDDVPTGVRGC